MNTFKSILFVSLVAVTPALASWTCAGQCGYMDGNYPHSVVPAALIFGVGNLPEDAYNNGVSKCAAVVPPNTKPLMVRGFVTYPDKPELLVISTACMKN